jgi:hypothetical protein
VAVHYSRLAGMKAPTAEYNCLKEFFSLEDIGYEYHNVKTDDNTVHSVAVGREGLRFYDETCSVIRRYKKFANVSVLSFAIASEKSTWVLKLIRHVIFRLTSDRLIEKMQSKRNTMLKIKIAFDIFDKHFRFLHIT